MTTRKRKQEEQNNKQARSVPSPTGSHGSEAEYALLFQHMDQAFCLMEVLFDDKDEPVDFRLVKANPAFVKQTGVGTREIGRTQRELMPDLEPHWITIWKRVASRNKPERIVGESKVLGRWYDSTIFPMHIDGKMHVALLFFDITDRMQFEKMLQQAVRHKDEVLATLGHELRNPLAAICTGLELMRLSLDKPEMHQKAYETAKRQSRQLVMLVEDLLEVSNIAHGKLRAHKTRVALSGVVKDAVDAIKTQIEDAGQHLSVDLPEQEVYVYADPALLTQVFSNLLENSAKYTPEKGWVSLEVWTEAGDAVVCVRDNGIGIPPAKQREIFEIFTQVDNSRNRRYSGLGLGLALAKSLTELHEGKIEVHSNGEGQGSAFTVRLPALQYKAEASEPEAPQPEDNPVSLSRVLIVDDNRDAAEVLADVSDIYGCEVKVAHSGREALELNASFRPDLILMDLAMPDMDGYETTRRLREMGEKVKIVALSGWGQEDDIRRTRDAGFDGHFVKPIEPMDLKALLADGRGQETAGPDSRT